VRQNSIMYHPQGSSLASLETTLKQAKVFSPPDVDERFASALIRTVKKQPGRRSPFAGWMGQPFPDEYREMVAADVHRG